MGDTQKFSLTPHAPKSAAFRKTSAKLRFKTQIGWFMYKYFTVHWKTHIIRLLNATVYVPT